MYRRKGSVAPSDRRTAHHLRQAFTLLAIGDTVHIGSRAITFARGEREASVTFLGERLSLIGMGEMITSMTLTFFYLLTLQAWQVRFHKGWNWFANVLVAAAGIRLVFLSLPLNKWERAKTPQPWSIYRNIPLLVLGLGQIYLILRDARLAGDRTFGWIGRMMLLSYAFYAPVIFFARRLPQLGLLMLPKSLAYLAIAIRAYRDLYHHPPQPVGEDQL